MSQLLHIKLRTILGIVCLVICILPSTKNISRSEAGNDCSTNVPFTADWSSLPLSDVTLINSYLSHIQDACRAYYAEKGEELPVVSWYYVSLKELKADTEALNPTVHITFTLMPYVGAHDPVGLDEVTFAASYTGQVTLVEYKPARNAAV